jgi:hypothetical protein
VLKNGGVEIVVDEVGERFGASRPVPDAVQPAIANAAASSAAALRGLIG